MNNTYFQLQSFHEESCFQSNKDSINYIQCSFVWRHPVYTDTSIHTSGPHLAVGFSYYPRRHNMGVYLVESWWLSGVVSSLVATATSSKANPPCRRQCRGPLDLRATYIFFPVYASPISRSTLPRCDDAGFRVSFQQLDKTASS